MTANNYIGKVVLSKAGRDRGKFFIVVGISDQNHVYISDGDLRPVEKLKKKKLKHLDFKNYEFQDIKELLNKNKSISNSMVKSFLQSYDKSKEV